MGQTTGMLPPIQRLTERQGTTVDEPDGSISADGLIFGTYMHGFFTSPPLRGAILRNLARRKGVVPARLGQRRARRGPDRPPRGTSARTPGHRANLRAHGPVTERRPPL